MYCKAWANFKYTIIQETETLFQVIGNPINKLVSTNTFQIFEKADNTLKQSNVSPLCQEVGLLNLELSLKGNWGNILLLFVKKVATMKWKESFETLGNIKHLVLDSSEVPIQLARRQGGAEYCNIIDCTLGKVYQRRRKKCVIMRFLWQYDRAIISEDLSSFDISSLAIYPSIATPVFSYYFCLGQIFFKYS